MKKTGMERAVNILTGVFACVVIMCLITICVWGTFVLVSG